MALGMPRGEMLRRMDSAELTEWMAFAQVEPFGAETQYYGQAINSQLIANINRKQGSKAYKAEDFMPRFEQEPQSPAQMVQIAEMFTAGLGGEDLRQENNDG